MGQEPSRPVYGIQNSDDDDDVPESDDKEVVYQSQTTVKVIKAAGKPVACPHVDLSEVYQQAKLRQHNVLQVLRAIPLDATEKSSRWAKWKAIFLEPAPCTLVTSPREDKKTHEKYDLRLGFPSTSVVKECQHKDYLTRSSKGGLPIQLVCGGQQLVLKEIIATPYLRTFALDPKGKLAGDICPKVGTCGLDNPEITNLVLSCDTFLTESLIGTLVADALRGKSPCFIDFLDFYRCENGAGYVLMEFVNGGNLAELSQTRADLVQSEVCVAPACKDLMLIASNDAERAFLESKSPYMRDSGLMRNILLQIFATMVILKKHSFLHNDMKAANVFLDFPKQKPDTWFDFDIPFMGVVAKVADFDKSSIAVTQLADDSNAQLRIVPHKRLVSAGRYGCGLVSRPDRKCQYKVSSGELCTWYQSRHSGRGFYSTYDHYVLIASILLEPTMFFTFLRDDGLWQLWTMMWTDRAQLAKVNSRLLHAHTTKSAKQRARLGAAMEIVRDMDLKCDLSAAFEHAKSYF